jgi:hypothetical protein
VKAAVRMKYIVISTSRHWSSLAGSCTYMRGVPPEMRSVPAPSVLYEASAVVSVEPGVVRIDASEVPRLPLSHEENHALPPASDG